MESTCKDTAAYNLQTSTMFVDMRFPNARPNFLKLKRSLHNLSDLELRILSRQHCFAGYTFPEIQPQTFTRHHIIDWNYHPNFPRTRPNRWWVELQPTGTSSDAKAIQPLSPSFKEFSTTRDMNGVPIYMERWQRLQPTNHQGEQQVVLWRQSSKQHPLAVLVVVGLHFSFTIDRDYSSAVEILKLCNSQSCLGGGPLFVDFLLNDRLHCDTDGSGLSHQIRRKAAEDYLSLIGDYGLIAKSSEDSWKIEKSTHPWREGNCLIRPGDLKWKRRSDSNRGSDCSKMQIEWKGQGLWEVFDASVSVHEIEKLFFMLPISRL
mmetsp:Transcript_20579/g.28360  ORF Transcript_20579/g.28360 Transcript_20579/m.28360 type:complete len:319 (-) Transcript_20579:413-1369(-)